MLKFDLSLYEKEVRSIINVLGSLNYRGISIKETLETSLFFLKQQYEFSKNKKYLELAVLYIQAYMSMGHVYEEEQEIFDDIVDELGKDNVLFTKSFMCGKKVKLSRGQVRSMIGRWMPSKKNPMKIGEVVDDIIKKVSKREYGRYYYEYTSAKRGGENSFLYELVINEEESFFHDITNQKYYILY